MDPNTRQVQRIAAGKEDVTPGLVQNPGWLFSLIGGAPQSGSTGYHASRYQHDIAECVADGGVVTQDRQIYEALMGLGVYQAVANPKPLRGFVRALAALGPVGWWRLGESGNARVATDQMGPLPTNLTTNPSFEADLAGWGNAGSVSNTQLQQTTTDSMFGNGCAQATVLSLAGWADRADGSIATDYTLANAFTVTQDPPAGDGAYTISVWVRSLSGRQIYVRGTKVVGTSPQWNSSWDLITTVTATGSWQQVSVTIPASLGLGTTYMTIRIGLRQTGTQVGDWVRVDGVQMVAGSSVPAFFYESNGGNDGDYIGSFSPNLIANPSFEMDVSGWNVEQSSGENTTLTRDTSDFMFGVACGLGTVTISAGGTIDDLAAYSFCNDNNQAPADDNAYTGSVYIKAASGKQVYLRVVRAVGASVQWATGVVGTITANGSWQRIVVNMPANPGFGTTSMVIRAGLRASGVVAGDVVRVDGFQLTQTPNSVPYSNTQGVTLGQPGPLGASGDTDTAILGDGQSGYVSVPANPALTGASTFSIAAWVKPNANTGSPTIMDASASTPNKGWRLQLNGTFLHFGYGTGSAFPTFDGGNVPLGSWSYVAGTYDGTTYRSYVNGVQVASAVAAFAPSSGPFAIGSYNSGGRYLSGVIDEVAVFNYALSASRVASLYAAASTP